MAALKLDQEAIFNTARKIAAGSLREEYLQQVCGDDGALHAGVLALLQAHGESCSFLEVPAAELLKTVDTPPITERPGTMIGPYKLLQQIGEGGMGTVYMAEQQEPVRRKVALKIIKPGMDSREVIARFEAERQALAMMDHVNIARVLEAGTTDTGRPYFVMELVHGVAITKYCDDKQLTPRQRLELFIPVCQAVQHAHQKGIIHRDIKPSNVMVTMYDDKPVPKIIDFGVAKAVEQRLTEKSLFTQYGALVGTFEYMSPEQAELNAFGVDTRSDIYSLGVLLYELLTGTTPLERQRLREAGYGEIVRLIKEEEPVRPSLRLSSSGAALVGISRERGTEPAKLTKVVRGELDWIVMRCLEKDRARRYETATGLAQDIQHHLSEEPVLACPPSTWYRFRKLARRNKAAVTTAAFVAATLLLGIVGTTVGLVRAVDAEGNALVAEAEAVAARDQESQQRLAAEDQRKLALTAAADARKSEKQARDSETMAAASAAVATKQEQIAREQAKVAEAARQEAQSNWTKAEWRLYASNIASAHREWETGSVSLLYHYLNQARPEFRGWEHDYLYSLANQNQKTLRGHTGGVHNVAFSADGKRLASASEDGTVKIWDAADGKELLSFKVKQGRMVLSVAFSPDGQRLVGIVTSARTFMDGKPGGGSFNAATDEVKLWDVPSGKELLSLKGHTGMVLAIAFSTDGKRLASAGGVPNFSDIFGGIGKTPFAGSGTVKIWDAVSGRELLTLKGHTSVVNGVAFSPDSRRLVTASSDKTLKLWELANGMEYLTIIGHSSGVESVAFSPDGKRLASAGADETLKLWDASNGNEILTIRGGGVRADVEVLNLPFSPVGRNLAFSFDGKHLACGSKNSAVRLWDTASGQETMTLRGHSGSVHSVAFSPDSKRLASAGDESVKVWDLAASQEPLRVKSEKKSLGSPTISPDGKYLASAPGSYVLGAGQQAITLWDAVSGQKIRTFKGHASGINSVVFSPDGKRLASAAGDYFKLKANDSGEVKLWDVATGEELRSLHGHTKIVTTVVFSSDGKRCASASWDNTLKLWDSATGVELLTLKGGRSSDLAISPDGRYLASVNLSVGPPPNFVGGTAKVELWDLVNEKKVLTLEVADRVGSVIFSPDGKLIATASDDQTVKLWDVATGQEVRQLKGHAGAVIQVLFSPDGKRLASASLDKTVKLWDVATGQEVLNLRSASGAKSLAFIADGKRLASASSDGTITIWDASMSMKELGQD